MAVLGMAGWPCVPGHELAGVAAAVGSAVTKVRVGDRVGVGCMVDSCFNCAACRRGEEQMCTGQTATYGAVPKHGRAATVPAGSRTLGGYSDRVVTHEHFVVKIPENYPLEFAGPVMCAGVTLFDPLRRYGAGAGSRVAVVGLGGLGVMGVKIAKAMGATVTVVSRTLRKKALADACRADAMVDSTDAAAMAAARGAFDLVLNTIPSEHDYTVYTALCARAGCKHIILGLNSALAASFAAGPIVCGSNRVRGSGIGSIEATQAVIDLCAAHDIRPVIQTIPVEKINSVYETLSKNNDEGVRYVIDIATLNEGAFARCKDVAAPKLEPSPPLSFGAILGTLAGMIFLGRAW
jgi:D-arabinose 1-dehydrogenase-like Zn-dependent alcohol dehydrogenase